MPIFFTASAPGTPLALDSFGNHWHQEMITRPQGFPLYHWLFTESGCGELTLEHQKFTLEKGQSVLIAPRRPHAYTGKAPGWMTAFATFNGSLAPFIPNIIGEAPLILAPESYSLYFKNWIDRIVSRYQNQQLTAPALSNECYDFLLHFSSLYNMDDHSSHPLYIQYVAPVVQQIETYYGTELTVTEMAKMVYVSPQYLNRLFQRFTGSTVYTYLTSYRITKAKELIIGCPKLTIQQIHSQVGFVNVSHFIAVFKKSTGYTPLQFRKLYGLSAD